MRILQIAPQIPYPLSDGGKVGIFNITKYLALRGHKITLLAFDRDGLVDVTPLQTFCELVTIRRSSENSKVGAFFNLFSSTPYNISKYRSRKFHAALSKLLACRRFDVVHVDHLHMAHYGVLCKSVADLPFVLREHNVESAIMERFLARLGSALFRMYVDSQLAQLRKYEAEMLLKVDCCCAITQTDAEQIR
ncbi:MAG: glycosyltransferase, partial [Bacteroidota bacterium]